MSEPGYAIQRLLDVSMRPGRLAWIGLRSERRGPVIEVERAQITREEGLVGDRFAGGPGATRQVTLIAQEDITAIAAFLGRSELSPALLRRNLVTVGVNLLALKNRRLRIGPAVLEITGECHPCSRLEEALGEGGYNAVRGRGGLTARVIEAGEVRVGDAVERA
jgi:MOSC domain-containing protein YiiM